MPKRLTEPEVKGLEQGNSIAETEEAAPEPTLPEQPSTFADDILARFDSRLEEWDVRFLYHFLYHFLRFWLFIGTVVRRVPPNDKSTNIFLQATSDLQEPSSCGRSEAVDEGEPSVLCARCFSLLNYGYGLGVA